ncbi:hypothetical protein JQ633_13185 [Bradyrhizobium tropiciagri]|uniref:hypothetical protein n=1 Tax=Bradyrhizobium tropiciagri TaxID=312253 RepID=UPI001BAD2C26|nr:hypothetical protein [Bradyrhizobium tropiciagri]MBR0871315.1 hypothetical protein [Bradyrhizobium tropiciagri]
MADFVDKIVKDPKNPPATVMLTGYLGGSSEPDHTRLYFDPHLSSYVDIPNSAILHQQDAKSDDGLQASYVWIARSAQLIQGAPAAERPKGTFLEGQIMQDHMAAAGGVAALQPTHAPMLCPITISPVQCPITLHPPQCPPRTIIQVQCPTLSVQNCPTLHFPCATRGPICDVHPTLVGCITQAPGCHPLPTRIGPHCFQTIVGPACLPRTIADPGCLASANVACPTLGGCPSIQCGDPGQQVGTPQAAAAPAAPQAQAQAAIATITPLGHICPSHTPGCGGHPTIMAIPTITPQGVVCSTHLPGCGGGGQTLVQLSFPTITPLGHICPTFGVNCPGPGHTLVQFMPTNFGNCTWYLCPPAG